MKSFTIAAFAGAAAASWAPPAYGGAESSAVVSSSVPAEEYSAPPAYSHPAEETSSSPVAPTGYTTSTPVESAPAYSVPAYGASSSSSSSSIISYGTGSAPAYAPKPTGSYGGSWGHGNETQGGNGGYGGSWGPGGETVTQVVSSFTTVCPYATTLTTNGATYTATESETLTITDCPCDVPTPLASYQPEYTTEVVTSFTTTCPEAGTYTAGPSTYTVSESTVITVTDCEGGCSITKPVPATVVVPSYTTVCPSPEAPTVITVESSTYSITDKTTITVQAPTSYATLTSTYSQPAQPETVVVESSTYEITSATEITYTMPTQQGYTITTPIESLPVYTAPPAASTPVAPVAPAPSAGYPAPPAQNGTGVSPAYPPQQTGNGAEKVMAGSAAIVAVIGALFL